MDADRWNRLRQILDDVGDLPDGDRDAALIEACGGDATLYEDLRALLAPRGPADSLIGGIISGAVSDLLADSAEGQRVGPYRIIREVGHGGMGAVYLAERVDGEFEQQVALKLVKPGLATGQFLRRFREERQILARLQHPHIARLLDGGVDDRGRPYFALEYVAGDPISSYCEAHRLSIDERLALFQQACSAVTHAHASLVVHRDLKPAHILITADREVRLLDFGIAKVLGDEATGPGLTQAGIRALTPDYASPEQVRGEAVGTATDVYSLGMILYELLAGVRPYDTDGLSPADVERTVCDRQPDRPSARGDHRLRGDLDVICLKALQKEPSRRYLSVEALSDDIARSRSGRPVLARPDSARYRAGKFVSRHRLGVGITAAVTIGFAAVIGFYTVNLASERDRTRLEATKAEQVSTFLRGLFEVSDPSESSGRSVTARQLLDEGAARIESELAGQPEVRASMMRVIGDVYASLGLFASARPLLETAYGELRRIHGDDHEETADGAASLATTLQDLGNVAAAEPLFRQALAIRERRFGVPHAKVSESLRNLAFLLETRNDMAGAEAASRRAFEMDRALFPPDGPEVAKSAADLAGLLRRLDRVAEAEPLLRQALAAQRRHFGDRNLTVASTIRNLASLLRDRGGLDEAEALYGEALATRRAILGDSHPDVAIALNSHALLLQRKGDNRKAATELREALRIMEQNNKDRPHADLAAGYSNLAASLRPLGEDEEAVIAYQRSIGIVDQVLAKNHPNRAMPRIGLAATHMEQRRFAAAEPLIRQALGIRRDGLRPGHQLIGDALVELGTCLIGLRRYVEAERELLAAQQLYRDLAAVDEGRNGRVSRRLDALYTAWVRPRVE